MVGAPPRVVIVGFGTLLESLSRCQLGVRHSPRVTVAVPTRPRVTIVVRRPPRVTVVVQTVVQQTGLVCPTHTPVAIVVQTLVRRPPRVAIVVQTVGETLGGKWVDVSISMV